MRCISFLLFFLHQVQAFDEDDYQIFKITDTLREVVGPVANFYSALDVNPDAEDREITKKYRKKSLEHHPDKTSSEESAKIYKALTSIVSILKNPKLRAKYDRHLKKGFPKWRGTDYYYDFFEPGIGFILVFVMGAISVAQYIVLWIFYYRQKQWISERNEETKSMTLQQVKRELARIAKEGGSVPTYSKQDLKEKSPAELLGLLSDPPKPSILDLFAFTVIRKVQDRIKQKHD